MTLLFSCFFSKVSGADGILSPPGFQFPVKELVASLKDLKESCTNSPFLVYYIKKYKLIYGKFGTSISFKN
jgi:hypothetical protein